MKELGNGETAERPRFPWPDGVIDRRQRPWPRRHQRLRPWSAYIPSLMILAPNYYDWIVFFKALLSFNCTKIRPLMEPKTLIIRALLMMLVLRFHICILGNPHDCQVKFLAVEGINAPCSFFDQRALAVMIFETVICFHGTYINIILFWDYINIEKKRFFWKRKCSLLTFIICHSCELWTILNYK